MVNENTHREVPVSAGKIHVFIPELADFLFIKTGFLLTEVSNIQVHIVFSTLERVLGNFAEDQDSILLVTCQWIKRTGISRIRRIADSYPLLNFLVYIRPSEIHKVTGLYREGISGFFSDHILIEEFQIGVSELVETGTFFSQEIVYRLLKPGEKNRANNQRNHTFTQVEKRVFELMVKGYQLMEIVDEMELSRSVIENSKCRLCKKLGVENLDRFLLTDQSSPFVQ